MPAARSQWFARSESALVSPSQSESIRAEVTPLASCLSRVGGPQWCCHRGARATRARDAAVRRDRRSQSGRSAGCKTSNVTSRSTRRSLRQLGFIGRVMIADFECYRSPRAYPTPAEALSAMQRVVGDALGSLLAGDEWLHIRGELGHAPGEPSSTSASEPPAGAVPSRTRAPKPSRRLLPSIMVDIASSTLVGVGGAARTRSAVGRPCPREAGSRTPDAQPDLSTSPERANPTRPPARRVEGPESADSPASGDARSCYPDAAMSDSESDAGS
jgi:hypothetical protein